MGIDFHPDDEPFYRHLCYGCGCGFTPQRRLFTSALLTAGAAAAFPALARDGVDVGEPSDTTRFITKLVPASQVEQAAQQQYRQMLKEAAQQRALAPKDHPQVRRLRTIAERIVPFTAEWNDRARTWRWEVNLFGGKQINAFCMPGGKIAFYAGILTQLRLNDDEVAMVMGHEMAHALREHARERIGKTMATRGLIELGSTLLGLGSGARYLADMGGQLLTLRFGRQDESEADLVGMELAARAGYDPRAGVSLWNKMAAANRRAPPQWLSTHPAGATRINDIQANLPKVLPLFERADKPRQRFAPPPAAQTDND